MRNIHAAIPQTVLQEPTPQVHAMAVREAVRVTPSSSGSFIWRTSAWLVFKLLIIIQILLPYIGYSFRRAAAIDNEYRISRRLFNTSVNTANYFGREGLRASQAVLAMNDGAVRDAIYSGAVYLAGQVAGGMQEGVQSAMNP
jgi:hypothetical protein